MRANGGEAGPCRRQRRSRRMRPGCKLGTGERRKGVRVPLRRGLQRKRRWDTRTYRAAWFDGRTGGRIMAQNGIHKRARCRERGRCRHAMLGWFQTEVDGRKHSGKVGRGFDVRHLGGWQWRKTTCAPASGNTFGRPGSKEVLRASQWDFGTHKRSSRGVPLFGGRVSALMRRGRPARHAWPRQGRVGIQ